MKVKDLIAALKNVSREAVVKIPDYDWDSGPEYNPPLIWVEVEEVELENPTEVRLV